MHSERFEQLVSEWLDSGAPSVRREIDELAAQHPELAEKLAQLERLEVIIRGQRRRRPDVRWERQRARILATLSDQAAPGLEASDDSLNLLLRRQPTELRGVDWERFGRRITEALPSIRRPAPRLRLLGRLGVGLGVAAGAAAAFFWLRPPDAFETAPRVLAAVATVSITVPTVRLGTSLARVEIAPRPTETESPALAALDRDDLLFMIDPPPGAPGGGREVN